MTRVVSFCAPGIVNHHPTHRCRKKIVADFCIVVLLPVSATYKCNLVGLVVCRIFSIHYGEEEFTILPVQAHGDRDLFFHSFPLLILEVFGLIEFQFNIIKIADYNIRAGHSIRLAVPWVLPVAIGFLMTGFAWFRPCVIRPFKVLLSAVDFRFGRSRGQWYCSRRRWSRIPC